MSDLLCQSSRCRGASRGGPRRVEPARPLCRECASNVALDLAEISTTWPDLLDQLAIPREVEERVSGTRSHGLAINEQVADLMREVIDWTWTLVRVVIDETTSTRLPASQDTPLLLAWLARWHARRLTYHADGDFAVSVAENAANYRVLVRRFAYPARSRRVEIPGRCIAVDEETQERCEGTLFAIVREDASLLPSEIVCDRDAQHRIPSGQWASYGRKVVALDQQAVLKLRASVLDKTERA